MTVVGCVNVRPCPRALCGAELCDTHQPTCMYCDLHDQHGYPLPKAPKPSRSRSWWQRARSFVVYRILRRVVCALFRHRWRSCPVVGHVGGPIIHYMNMCRRCVTMDSTLVPRQMRDA